MSIATKIADVYLRPPKSLVIPTYPGGRVEFHGGHAEIHDERNLLHILRRADAVIVPTNRYVDFFPKWIAQCGVFNPARATLELPDGITLSEDGTAILRTPQLPVGEAEPIAPLAAAIERARR